MNKIRGLCSVTVNYVLSDELKLTQQTLINVIEGKKEESDSIVFKQYSLFRRMYDKRGNIDACRRRSAMILIQRIVVFWNVFQSLSFVTALLNTTTCLQYLSQSDQGLDYKLYKDEYLLFIRSVSCTTIQGLTANQISIFESLACNACQSRDEGSDCCSDPNMYIPIDGIDGPTSMESSSAPFLCDIVSILVVGETKPNCPPVETAPSLTATSNTATNTEQNEVRTSILMDPGTGPSFVSSKLKVATTPYPSIVASSVYPTRDGQFEPLPTPPLTYPTPNGQTIPLAPTPWLGTVTPTTTSSPSPVLNSNPPNTDPPTSTEPPVSISDACTLALEEADGNGDSQISRDEYITFIALWACKDAISLTDALSGSFDVLRCLFFFCGPEINVVGIHLDPDSRSTYQQNRLAVVCTTTGSSLLLGGCPDPTENPPSLGVPTTTISPTRGTLLPPPTDPLPTLAPTQKIPVAVPTPIDIEPTPAPSEALFLPPTYKVTTIEPTNSCYSNLLASDANGNGRLDELEYFDFLKRSMTGNCSLIQKLTTQDILNLRTWCLEDGYDFCATLPEISISGAQLDPSDQTLVQVNKLNRICNSVPTVCPAPTPIPTTQETTPVAAQAPPSISPTNFKVITSIPTSGSDFELRSCSARLTNADQNGDNAIDEMEYRTLLRLWIGCNTMDTITDEQSSIFGILSCQCQGRMSTSGCCASSPSQFPINITRLYAGKAESDQNQWLTTLCGYIRLVAKPPCPQPKDYPWVAPSTISMPSTVSPTSVVVNITTPTRLPTDIPRCGDALVNADTDQNDWLTSYEFLDFIVLYAHCDGLTTLSQSQEDTFYRLACLCLNVTGASNKCCLPRNARIEIDGARLLASARSQQQNESLTTICDAAAEIFSAGCVSPLPQVPNPSLPTPPTQISVGLPAATPQTAPTFGAVPSTIPIVSEQCIQSLVQSDVNNDGYINATEYLSFLRLLGGCDVIISLSDQQQATFLLLAGAVEISPSTNFSIASALVPQNSRTYEQADFLSKVCLDSNGNCVASPTAPPVVVDDLNECMNALSHADSNDDKLLSIDEYLVFVRTFTNCSVFPLDRSSMMYNAVLLSKQTTTSQLNITGAGFAEDDLTDEQKSGLSQICLTSKQMAGQCISNPVISPQVDACSTNLVFADRNRDKKLTIEEYLDFVRKQYNYCTEVPYLSLSQRIVFQFLACFCLQQPGATWGCCDPSNAGISIDGASVNESNRTSEQSTLLTYICTSTNDALDTCPRSTPPAPAITKSHGGYLGVGAIKIFIVILSVFFVWDR